MLNHPHSSAHLFPPRYSLFNTRQATTSLPPTLALYHPSHSLDPPLLPSAHSHPLSFPIHSDIHLSSIGLSSCKKTSLLMHSSLPHSPFSPSRSPRYSRLFTSRLLRHPLSPSPLLPSHLRTLSLPHTLLFAFSLPSLSPSMLCLPLLPRTSWCIGLFVATQVCMCPRKCL